MARHTIPDLRESLLLKHTSFLIKYRFKTTGRLISPTPDPAPDVLPFMYRKMSFISKTEIEDVSTVYHSSICPDKI